MQTFLAFLVAFKQDFATVKTLFFLLFVVAKMTVEILMLKIQGRSQFIKDHMNIMPKGHMFQEWRLGTKYLVSESSLKEKLFYHNGQAIWSTLHLGWMVAHLIASLFFEGVDKGSTGVNIPLINVSLCTNWFAKSTVFTNLTALIMRDADTIFSYPITSPTAKLHASTPAAESILTPWRLVRELKLPLSGVAMLPTHGRRRLSQAQHTLPNFTKKFHKKENHNIITK